MEPSLRTSPSSRRLVSLGACVVLLAAGCKTSDREADRPVAQVGTAAPFDELALTGKPLAPNEIPVGVAEFPPFKYRLGERIVGSDTEIVEQVFQRMGMVPRITMAPWKRIQIDGSRGRLAAIYTFTKSKEREQSYFFSQPISTVQDVFFKRKDDQTNWSGNYADLAEIRIGVAGGYSYAPAFMQAMSDGTLRRVDRVTDSAPEIQNLRKLARGRLDLVVCEVSVCAYLIRQAGDELDELTYIDRPIGTVRTFHVGFPRSWPGAEELQKRFDLALAQFVKEGRRKPIFERYGVKSTLD